MQEKLFTPGPTEIPERILRTLSEPVIHHRTEAHKARLRKVIEGMKRVMMTEGDLVLIASSGTGAMEAAVSSLARGRGEAIVVNAGKFGERWSELCGALGIPAREVKAEEGKPLDPRALIRAVEEHDEVQTILATLTETSTGVVHDIEGFGRLLRGWKGILIVDAVSGLVADELRMDAWRVDVVLTGSQKGLMLPPGLSAVALSPRARRILDARAREREDRGYYFDLLRYVRSLEKDWDVPFTPAIGLIRGLEEALDMLLDEGMEAVWKRHHRVASAVRAACQAMGMVLFAEARPSNAVTAAFPPPGISPSELIGRLCREKGIRIAGGQGSMKDKIVRIAHLGACFEEDVLGLIGAMETCLREMGSSIGAGTGLLAAEAVLSSQ